MRASNDEVEGPRGCAGLEPRVHPAFPHPRRHYQLSRPPPTIVRRLRPPATVCVKDDLDVCADEYYRNEQNQSARC